VTSLAEDDPRPPFQRAIDQLEQLAARATPEQLAGASVLPGWDTRRLIGHIVGDIHRIAYAGEGGRLRDVAAMAGEIADDDWAGAVAGRGPGRRRPGRTTPSSAGRTPCPGATSRAPWPCAAT